MHKAPGIEFIPSFDIRLTWNNNPFNIEKYDQLIKVDSKEFSTYGINLRFNVWSSCAYFLAIHSENMASAHS